MADDKILPLECYVTASEEKTEPALIAKTKHIVGLKPFVLLMCREMGSPNYLYSWMITGLYDTVTYRYNTFPDCSFEDVKKEFIRVIKELGFESRE